MLNTGSGNAGSLNTGWGNLGDLNTGVGNSGNVNTGAFITTNSSNDISGFLVSGVVSGFLNTGSVTIEPELAGDVSGIFNAGSALSGLLGLRGFL